MIVFLLKGGPHCCLWWGCEVGHSYGNCSNSRTLRSFEDPRRVHGDPWQSEAHPNVTSHEQRQVQAVKGKVSEYAWISASGFGEYFCWGISSVFVLLRWAPRVSTEKGLFCRGLSTRRTKTLPKSCWNLGEFCLFLTMTHFLTCQGWPDYGVWGQHSNSDGYCSGERKWRDDLPLGRIHRDARPCQALLPFKADVQGWK